MGDARRRSQLGLMPTPAMPFFEDVPAEYRSAAAAIPAALALMLYGTIDGEQFDPAQVRRDTEFLPAEHSLDIRVAALFNPPLDDRFYEFLCDYDDLSLLSPDGEIWQAEFRKAIALTWASEVAWSLMERVSEFDDDALDEKVAVALDAESPIISLGDLIKHLGVTP